MVQRTPDPDGVEAVDSSQLTRREVLRRTGMFAGGVGAAALLGACSAPNNAAWTTIPAKPVGSGTASGTGSGPGATAAAPASVAVLPAPAESTGATSDAPSPSPSASAAPRNPSPADIAIPPAYRPHRSAPVDFSLESFDGPGQAILIAPGKVYNSMNFMQQVPAPTLRVTEGDTVHFTLTNKGSASHSIDFHAARTPWDKNYQDVKSGESFSFDWTATAPGVFMYHCGSQPVLMHIGDGMYGAVIVDPTDGRGKAREYVVVQSEFYGTGGDYPAMLAGNPDVVAFNGQAHRYRDAPLPVTAGEKLRLFLVNAGPNNVWAFHVIGALIDYYEQDGNPDNAQGLHQSVEVLPGGGALVELTIPDPGKYPFVTHKMNDMDKGAMGVFEVTAS